MFFPACKTSFPPLRISPRDLFFALNLLWKTNAPSNIQVFTLRLFLNRLQTKDELAKRGIMSSSHNMIKEELLISCLNAEARAREHRMAARKDRMIALVGSIKEAIEFLTCSGFDLDIDFGPTSDPCPSYLP
ncbi:hypothetical protein KIW84_044889 [Lathyrus oleraceus]|uniref:Reverse transcriptase zinc-binding domain-containing protein n=1 Tax=Pisum sativum TaxID=3888 RepID=A0A9D5AVZ1_PEA|nr:hypothetical protein KIW84_044889 [Pisum sativum]